MNKKDKQGYLLIVMGIIGFLLIILRCQIFECGGLGPDFCGDNKDPHHTVVVIDTSDPFNTLQKEWLLKYFEGLVWGFGEREKRNKLRGWENEAFSEGTRISLYELNLNTYENLELPALISKCIPPTGEGDIGIINNPAQLQRAWNEGFLDPFNEKIESLVTLPQQSESPIAQGLTRIATQAFLTSGQQTKKKIIIISDLLQNYGDYSQYVTNESYVEAKKRIPSFFTAYTPNLEGVKFKILFIRRAGEERKQNSKHKQFWLKYLCASGSESCKLKDQQMWEEVKG